MNSILLTITLKKKQHTPPAVLWYHPHCVALAIALPLPTRLWRFAPPPRPPAFEYHAGDSSYFSSWLTSCHHVIMTKPSLQRLKMKVHLGTPPFKPLKPLSWMPWASRFYRFSSAETFSPRSLFGPITVRPYVERWSCFFAQRFGG